MAVTPAIQQARGEWRPPHPALPAAIRALVRSMPTLLRAGFAVLALGLVLDVAYHVAIASGEHEHGEPLGTAALAIHLVVVAGMALSLAGLAITALGHRGNARSIERR